MGNAKLQARFLSKIVSVTETSFILNGLVNMISQGRFGLIAR